MTEIDDYATDFILEYATSEEPAICHKCIHQDLALPIQCAVVYTTDAHMCPAFVRYIKELLN